MTNNATVVSLHRAGGDAITLGNGDPTDQVLLLNGSQGLGLAPPSYSTAARPAGHGSLLRGSRLDEREIFVPVLVDCPTASAYNTMIERLTRLLSPLDTRELTLRVTLDGLDEWREIPIKYAGGLAGDYGPDYHGSWGKHGLEFRALDALWRGRPQTITQAVDAGDTKPFLSDTEPFFPVILADATINGVMEVHLAGDAPTFPVWTIVPPGEDLLIRHLGTGQRFYLDGLITEPITIDMGTRLISSPTYQLNELNDRLSRDSRFFALQPGHNELEFVVVNATDESKVHITYTPHYLRGH